jgi:hypothetical protein
MLLNASYSPYAGYAMPYKSLGTVGTLMATALEVFVAELVTTSMFLYIWPSLLFIGLVLRATMFTRKIGGLFIAIALGAILIYPAVFATEYLSVGNGLYGAINTQQGTVGESIGQAYGFNSITTNSITEIDYSNSSNPAPRLYTPNFYVEPNVALIANHDGCWPPGNPVTVSVQPLGGLPVKVDIGALGEEAADTFDLLIPGSAAVKFVTSLLSGQVFLPNSWQYGIGAALFGIPYACSPQQVESLAFSMFNFYGIMSVSVLFLPIINLMITLGAIVGLSGLFGGDTALAGLAKLV